MAYADTVLWLFTLGYFAQFVGTSILLYKIRKQRSIYGLSVDTQQMFLLAAIVRVIWVFDTRLTQLSLVYVEMVLSILFSLGIVYYCHKYRHTTTVQARNWSWILIAICAVLAFLFHPGKKNEYWWTMQILVAFSLYLEAGGLMPQLVVMRKIGEVEPLTSHYMFCLAASRFLRLGFWILMWLDGDKFFSLMAADLIHTLLLSDYVYYYLKSLTDRKRLILGSV
eukprot:GILK01001736.1.p1 GENE.GILK01001736.1~~GILK01001736.1.p1  ORF type:complete len:224 (-),score=33.43 GILK01001736.1:198-869(-)